MKPRSAEPFETIESAQEYVSIFTDVIAESRLDIDADVKREAAISHSRRLDALRVAAYNLRILEQHIRKSSRILNDLRTLRRLLLQEREPIAVIVPQLANEAVLPLTSEDVTKHPAAGASVRHRKQTPARIAAA